MKKLVLFAVALGSLVVACAPPTTINITPGAGGAGGGNGGSDGGGGNGNGGSIGDGGASTTTTTPSVAPNAHDVYVKEVQPSLIQTCGGCHNPQGKAGAPVYLDYDAEVSYPLTKGYKGIVQQPADKSILVTKGAHEGPALSPDQVTIVENWVQMELDSGGGSGGAGGGGTGTTSTTTSAVTLESMLDSFAKCMDIDLWTSSGMAKFPLQQTNGAGPCMSCHNTGTGGTWLSGDPQETFDNNKTFPYIMRLVKPVYEGGTPTDLAPSDRFINKGNEPCQNPPICHPKFDLTPTNKQAFETFVGNTLTKWHSGVCGK